MVSTICLLGPLWDSSRGRPVFRRISPTFGLLVAVICLGGQCIDFRAQCSSTHHSIPKLVENQGSGFRSSGGAQLTSDTISPQPVDVSTSENFILQGNPLVTVETTCSSCGIYINDNEAATATVNVDLSLICGHPSGCTQMQLSNNGVGWTTPEPYATSRAWTLTANDGTRKVFVKFQNGLGNWSGACWDSILMDTVAPSASISPVGGTYMGVQSITLTASEPATLKYTTDGSDPTTSPTALTYSAPFTLSDDATVKAFATDLAGHASPVVSEIYEVCTGSNLSLTGKVLDASRNNAPMPLVVITLDDGTTTRQATTTTGDYSFTGLPRGWYEIVSVTSPVAGYVTYQASLKLCETPLVHNITLTRLGTIYGKDTNSGYSSGGVNTSTGNYCRKETDHALPGIGPSFVLERSYNSQDGTNGPLGYGWTWSYNIATWEQVDTSVVPNITAQVVRWGDGKTEVWEQNGTAYEPMYGVFSTLIKNPDSTFTLQRKDLVEYRFNLAGKLASVVDEYGNAITFDYSEGDLTLVVDTAGRKISFSYDASHRLTNVLDPVGRSSTYAYDVNGNLASATARDGRVTRYTYDDQHQMLTIVDPKGNTALTNGYDLSRNTVVTQRDALGNETRFVYDAPNRVTTIIDPEGNTAHHHFDSLLRLTQEEDGRGFSAYRTFDERGNLATAKDKRGNTTTFVYDTKGNVLTKTEPLGRVTSATYDASNNPLTKTDALGRTTLFEYDPVNGNLLAQYDCGGVPPGTCTSDPTVNKITYAYDSGTGQLLTGTQATGTGLQRTTTSQYDVFGNKVAVIDAMGNTSTFEYDEVGRKLVEYHPLGRAMAFEYDAMDRLLTVTDALGGVTQYAYDANGNKTAHHDARSKLTTFTYDTKDRLVVKTDALNAADQFCYDGMDRRTSVTNARGATSLIVYDAVGNVVQEIDALGNVIRHEYDANGNRMATTDAKGRRSTFTYDELNRLMATTDPLGRTTAIEYDLNGNKTRVTDALGQSTVFTYDAFNQLRTVTDAEGNTTTNFYDLLGRLVKVRDARGNDTDFEYDALDRLVGVTDAAEGSVSASYDALGNRLSVTDPRGKVTTYLYDVLNRLTGESDPLGNATAQTYDAVGNLLTLSNADGTTVFTYDDVNRITEVAYPDLTTASYTYDARGNRLTVTDLAGTTSFTYDLLDRVSGVTDPFGNALGYTYDPAGNRSSVRYPGYKSVTYLFDELNRLVSVQDWGGVTTTYAYDAAGRLASQVMGNGATVTYTYDDAGRLIGKEDRTAGEAVIASYSYTLDPSGNRTGMGLTQPLLPKVELLDQLFTHNDGNQVVTNNAVTYTYDGKGNRKTAVDGAVTTQYAYDFNNRLTRVEKGADLWEYLYTSDGKRVSSTVNGTQTRYLLDLNGPMETVLAEMNGTNAVKRYYIYGDGLLYSVDGSTGERLFYHYDPLGSTVALTNLAGAVTDSYAYLPYGELSRRTGTHENPFLYVGKFGVMRESNGLSFMRARYYDPETRRFVSEDPLEGNPVEPGTLDPYSYALDSPTRLSDPSGESWYDVTNVLSIFWDSGVYLYDQWHAASMEEAWGNAANYLVSEAMYILPGVSEVYSFNLGYRHHSRWRCGPNLACQAGVNQYNRDQQGQRGGSATQSPWTVINFGMQQEMCMGYSQSVGMVSGGSGSQGNAASGGTTNSTGTGTSSNDPPKRPYDDFYYAAEYAPGMYKKQYKYITAPDFLDKQTLSYVEYRVAVEVSKLARKRYGYYEDDSKGRKKAKERMRRDIQNSIDRLYVQLTKELSKHQVLIRDISSMPTGSTSGIAMTGVYAGGN